MRVESLRGSSGGQFMGRILGAVLVLGLGPSATGKGQGRDRPATPAQQYQKIVKEYQDAQAAASSARLGQVALRSLELAEKYPRDPVAVDALIQVVRVYNSSAPPGQDNPAARAV